MKNRIKILTAFCLLLIIGGGCTNSQKITQLDIKEITKNSSSLTPKEGPFANIKFIFYNPEQMRNLSLTSSDVKNGDLVFAISNLSEEGKKIMQAVAKQKPLEQTLSEITTSTYRKVYSYTFNEKVIDEVRCFDVESFCERYLALDQDRSIIITDYYSLSISNSKHVPFYSLFDFEFQPKKPEIRGWELVENFKDLTFSFYRPTSLSLVEIQENQIINLYPQTMSHNLNQVGVRIEILKQEAGKLIDDQKLNSAVMFTSREDTVNGIPVTGLCSKNNTECTYYFSRPGQDTIRVTEFNNEYVYKTLQFKRYYPYNPLNILSNNK